MHCTCDGHEHVSPLNGEQVVCTVDGCDCQEGPAYVPTEPAAATEGGGGGDSPPGGDQTP